MMNCWHCGIYDAHTPIGLCVKCDSVSSMLMSEQTKQRLKAQQAVIGAVRVAYVAGIENLSRSGERMPAAYTHLLAALGDALDALNGTEPDDAG